MRKAIAVLTMVAVTLSAASSAQALQIGGGSLSAEVTADVKPDRLPRRGFGPANLIVRGKVNPGEAGAVNAIELYLDRRLRATANAKGLATCRPASLAGLGLAQAKKRCGKALIGSGSVDKEFFAGSEIQFSLRQTVLLFNAEQAGRIVVYTFQPRVGTFVPSALVTRGTAKGRSVQLRFMRSAGGATTGFRFRIGRTWRDRGRKRSLLLSRCAGRFANRITLRFNRAALTGTVVDSCQGR